MTRTFVLVGSTARVDANVRLDDLPGTSGRLDVMARCVRAALCVSHGIRQNAIVHVVLLGGPTPVTVRIDGARAKFIRPDERALATILIKAVGRHEANPEGVVGFVEQRHGIAVAWGGLEVAIADTRGVPFILEEGAEDLRPASSEDAVFFIGDHLGFAADVRAQLAAIRARSVSVGPVSLHSDDVVALVSNELDRVTSTP